MLSPRVCRCRPAGYARIPENTPFLGHPWKPGPNPCRMKNDDNRSKVTQHFALPSSVSEYFRASLCEVPEYTFSRFARCRPPLEKCHFWHCFSSQESMPAWPQNGRCRIGILVSAACFARVPENMHFRFLPRAPGTVQTTHLSFKTLATGPGQGTFESFPGDLF